MVGSEVVAPFLAAVPEAIWCEFSFGQLAKTAFGRADAQHGGLRHPSQSRAVATRQSIACQSLAPGQLTVQSLPVQGGSLHSVGHSWTR